MFMEEPKVEFVSIEMGDVVTESPGSSIAICQGHGDSQQDCSGGAMYNY
jgi:hypothetical protein